MIPQGKGINFQVPIECIYYLLFGYLLFQLTFSGGYLNCVIPRVKPYLYGMSTLVFLWTVFTGRYLLTPRHRVRLARSFVFIIPILLLAFRPADPGGSSMVRSYESSGFSMGFGNGGTDIYPGDDTGQSYGEENPWYNLRGLDETEKTTTIADEDYYTRVYELSNFYEEYGGYTVVMKGFVFRTPDIQKKHDFALVRLSMWCCAVDLIPIGFLVDSDSEVTFKDDDQVAVMGTFGISEHEEFPVLKAQSTEAVGKPEEEYVYPHFQSESMMKEN